MLAVHRSSLMVRIDKNLPGFDVPVALPKGLKMEVAKWDILQTCEIAHETLHRRCLDYAVRLRELSSLSTTGLAAPVLTCLPFW